MGAPQDERPLVPRVVAVLGPTASGKSALALELASGAGGEIVCCDSMQVYRGLDIGTGKPTAEERARVPHHLYDVVAPDEDFHAGAWAARARGVIHDIVARGRLPFIVGGTGLYFRALVAGLFDAPPPSPEIRARHKDEAARLGVPALHARLAEIDKVAASKIAVSDLVRTSRALEVYEQTGTPISVLWAQAPPPTPLEPFAIVFERSHPELAALISARVDAMMAAGFLGEVRALRAAGYAQARALAGLGYRELGLHLDGELPLDEAVALTKKNTTAYARRQRTWFRKQAAAVRLEGDPDTVSLAAAISRFRAGLSTRPVLR